MKKEDIELLAPAGSFDALKAAVQNGANAIYLGGQNLVHELLHIILTMRL